ncbi:phosphoribosylamine--glycine ligase [Candidatus Thorarchaeota archaeon]|nr:MAG: phosphoribosylamine--glycine ligase [Candidatus Thorarchaeota archaeon]
MTKVLLIGNGAREHAIATALSQSDVEIHAHMERKNPGIAKLCKEFTIGSTTETKQIPDLADIDYAIVGPEAPLAVGVSDFIIAQGVPCIAPCKAAAMIETSKTFARLVIQQTTPKANPRFISARSLDDLRRFEKEVGVENIVVKPNGLTGGKGVKIFGEHLKSRDELEKYAISLLTKEGVVVLEEKLEGIEFTMQAFSDGNRLELMPLVRDYKRAFDGDTGPNTGSMGSLSTPDHGLPYVSVEDFEAAKAIMDATLIGIKKKAGSIFKGILYGQFMKTETGVKVIEYNARFGDPEAMNVLSILSTPMDEVCQRIIDGNLGPVEFENKATVCVYVVPEGYPGPDVVKDSPIDTSVATSAQLYYASVYEKEGEILTTGSRAIGVLGKGDSVAQAREIAYANASRIKGRLRFRSDIAE